MISFKATNAEYETIATIAARAQRIDKQHNGKAARDVMNWHMDIIACHANGCLLKLEELAVADDFDFVHDVFGIAKHLDRKTGKLTSCFLPRYAV